MKIKKNSPTFLLMGLYFFIAPFGELFRVPTEKYSFGLTTIIMFMIIGINIVPAINLLFKEKLLYLWLIMILWLLMTSSISYDPIESLTRTLMIFIYLLLAAAVATVRLEERALSVLFFLLLMGATLSSVATIIDYVGLVNIPLVNNSEDISTRTVFGSIIKATGFFLNRSAMAAFFSLIMPLPIILAIQSKRNFFAFYVLCLYAVFLSCFICLILTHNRSGALSALISIAVIAFFIQGGKRAWLFLFKLSIFFISLLFLINLIFPEIFNVYMSLLGLGNSEIANVALQEESDYLRMTLFQYALENLAINPIGNGLTPIDLPHQDVVDPHNNITQLIWAGGLFAICWVILFGCSLFRRIRKYTLRSLQECDHKVYYYTIAGGLLSWFFSGMAHTALNTGLAWVFFGLLLNLMRSASRALKGAAPQGRGLNKVTVIPTCRAST